MTSRTATLRLQMIDSVSGPSKNAASSLRGIDTAIGRLGRGGSPQIQRLAKQLENLKKKAGSIDDFTASRRGFKDLATQMGAARSNVSKLEAALKSASKPTMKMQADLAAARAALKTTTSAFRDQGAAVRQSEGALRSFGIAGRRDISGSQKAIRSEIAQTIREMRRLDMEARKPKPQRPPVPPSRRPPGAGSVAFDAASAVAGGYVASTGKSVAEKSFFSAIDFNKAAEYQAAIGDFKGKDRDDLNRQAMKIGGDTRFNNVDVVKAQTQILQGGVRDPKTIMALTGEVTKYALAMGTTLEEAAETVRGAALSKRVDLKDVKKIGDFVDFIVWMGKNGGMGDEDLRQYMKYGGASTTGAGLPDAYSAAMGMVLRHAGVRGDEAGVFARSASSKLVAPTRKGKNALYAMGIDYADYTKIDSMNAPGIGKLMKNNFGVHMTPEMKLKMQDLIDNGEFTDEETGETRSVISDAGEFSDRASEILAPLFSRKGKKMSASDAKALSRDLGDYQKNSVESVDTVGLLKAIASANPTLGQLNSFFTDKQGGRANMIFSAWPEFLQMLNKMQNVPPGIANQIGVEANSGIYGDWTKMTGTIESAMQKIGEDWEFATRPMINKVNDIVDGFSNLSEGSRQLVEAFGGAATLLAGYKAAQAGTSFLERIFGGGGGAAAGTAGGAAAGAAVGGSGGLASKLAAGWGALRMGAGLSFITSTLGDTPGDTFQEQVKNQREYREAIQRLLGIGGTRSTGQPPIPGLAPVSAEDGKRKNAIRRNVAAPIQGQLVKTTFDWPIAAQVGMQDYASTLAKGGADAEAKAAQIAESIKTELSITATPAIETGQLERALSLARQLAAALRGEASGVAVSAAPSTGAVGHPRARGGPVKAGVTYPVGGKGVELFTPGADGFITPNGAGGRGGGGGTSVVMHNHFHGGKSTDFEEAARILDRQLNRAADLAFSGIRYGDK